MRGRGWGMALLCVMGAFVACKKETETSAEPGAPPEAVITFTPSCGKSGDTVSVLARGLVDTGRAQDDTAPCFSRHKLHEMTFHPGVKVTYTLAEDGKDCILTTTVPEAARTGTIDLELDGTTYASKDVFTVPCPDPSPEAGSPEGGSPEGGTPEGGTTCTPKGSASGPPTGEISDESVCVKGKGFISNGKQLGDQVCVTFAGVTVASIPGDPRRFEIPPGIAPGTYPLTITGPGGTLELSITIAPGEAPNISSVSPTTAAPGTQITVGGTGFTGLTQVTVLHFADAAGPPDKVVNVQATVNGTGTALTFDLPGDFTAGTGRVQTSKPDCGWDEAEFTIQ